MTTQWTYDANGNRKTENTGTYNYLAGSNRLTSTPNGSITLDAAGNTTFDGLGRSFSYNQAGELSAVPSSGASYAYNAHRQRTRKVVGSEATVYHYDLMGNLIAETRTDGSLIRDYVWVDGTPIAKIEAGETIAYLHTDHLNTPRLATSPQGQVVWRWEATVFGDTAPNEDPGNTGITTRINLRYPGQYYDAETGLFYNWNRYYDPKIGRYISSDPIGLDGGLNAYAYVLENPLRFVDPSGLITWTGTVTSGSWIAPIGMGGFYFDLTSDCVNKKRGHIKVVASGIGFGLEIRGVPSIPMGSVSSVSFEDGTWGRIDPSRFNGRFVAASSSILVGKWGGSFGGFTCGNAATGLGLGGGKGFDIGISGVKGTCGVLEVKIEDCDCKKD